MAYLGTPPKSRVLSSADIATGAITLDDISFTDQSTSVNISGNIDKHTMRLSDEVVIDGDLNITDNLILSKISDDGNAITLTPDGSTRTITGTGSLEASTLTQTPNASLTGMTGEIGSAVTFPTGSIIQTVYATTSIAQSVTSGGGSSNTAFSIADNPTFLTKTITPTTANSKFLLQFNSRCRNQMGATGYNANGYYYLTDGTSTIALGWTGHDKQAGTTTSFHEFDNAALCAIHEPNTTSNVTYSLKFHTDAYYTKTFTLSYGATPSFLIIQEIAG